MTADHSPRQIDLAQEPAFSLGPLEVRPATLEVIAGDRREQLEPRIMQVLVALARRRGEVVSRDELIATCWGGRIVGDDAINRCISQLRKLAEGVGGFAIETVPRVGFRLSETSATSQPPRRRGRLAAALAVLLAVIAGAGFAVWALRAPGPAEREMRVALIAFEPLERDAATSAFARRLTDEVGGVLNENVAGLAAVRPESAAAPADFRMGGSVQVEGGALRVRAYIEDGGAKVGVWSRQYERAAAEEDELRTEVAVDLSDKLLFGLEALQQKGLKLDHRALALWLKAGDGGDRQLYEQIVERAPQFASARGSLAQILALSSRTAPPTEALELRRRARAEAERAIRIDPTKARAAYDALYWLARLEAPEDIARAEDVLIGALSRTPNAEGQLLRRCQLLIEVGRAGAALPNCQRAVALRPLGAAWGYRYARALAASGQPERAREVIDRERHFHPEFDQTRQARFEIAAFTESPAEALATLRDAARPPAAFTGAEVEAWEAFLKARASGATADADLAAAKLRTTVQERRMSRQLAFRALVTLSRMDDAYAAVAEAGPELIAMGGSGWLFDPGMEAAWRDPRFWPLAARTGLIRYWRTRNVLPDFCATPGLPYDCRTEMAKYG